MGEPLCQSHSALCFFLLIGNHEASRDCCDTRESAWLSEANRLLDLATAQHIDFTRTLGRLEIAVGREIAIDGIDFLWSRQAFDLFVDLGQPGLPGQEFTLAFRA